MEIATFYLQLGALLQPVQSLIPSTNDSTFKFATLLLFNIIKRRGSFALVGPPGRGGAAAAAPLLAN